jgi:hypothetical protein
VLVALAKSRCCVGIRSSPVERCEQATAVARPARAWSDEAHALSTPGANVAAQSEQRARTQRLRASPYHGPAASRPAEVRPAPARARGRTIVPAATSRDAAPMLTPKVTELTRAGRPWVTTPLPPTRPLPFPR